ncbi:hypothetical protein [Actinomadura sp. NPDC049753]|uniref:hypothetical protein n=1 Tax=Actinomadura sp. NPDC049753 TaxID=3154739 RepID=UPI00341D2441
MAPSFRSDDLTVEALFPDMFRRREAGWCVARRLYRRLASRRGGGARPRCRVVLALDIARFTGHDEATQIHLREVMYRIVGDALAAARIGRRGSRMEDRGDGLLMVLRAQASLDTVLPLLFGNIRERVQAYNATAVPSERLRLRAALHAGFLHRDRHGVTGDTVNLLFRMLDAPAMKRRLDDEDADFALAVSPNVYEAATGYRLIDGKDFELIDVDVKQTRTSAWLYLAPPPRPARRRPHPTRVGGRSGLPPRPGG